MRKIDTEKLSKEMNDTLIHRQCVIRSGQYLAKYLIKKNRSVDAIRLIGRCQIHDMSKINNAEEFMSLASIVDSLEDMRDIAHSPNEEQTEARRIHWKRNSHHPEYYDTPNDMTDLDLMEMACDCHARSKQFGTDLMEYIKVQQEIRFHFDSEHLRKLKMYCIALTTLSKDDDYSTVLNPDDRLCFDLKDSTLAKLEMFDDTGYPNVIKTDRLYLQKEDNPDFASVVYIIYTQEGHDRIGEIAVKFNGYLEYYIYQNYFGNGFTREALQAVIDNSHLREIFLSIRKDNDPAQSMATHLGFAESYSTENSKVYRYTPKKA